MIFERLISTLPKESFCAKLYLNCTDNSFWTIKLHSFYLKFIHSCNFLNYNSLLNDLHIVLVIELVYLGEKLVA